MYNALKIKKNLAMRTPKLIWTVCLFSIVSFAAIFLYSCKNNSALHQLYNESASPAAKIGNQPVMALLNDHMVNPAKEYKNKDHFCIVRQ